MINTVHSKLDMATCQILHRCLRDFTTDQDVDPTDPHRTYVLEWKGLLDITHLANVIELGYTWTPIAYKEHENYDIEMAQIRHIRQRIKEFKTIFSL